MPEPLLDNINKQNQISQAFQHSRKSLNFLCDYHVIFASLPFVDIGNQIKSKSPIASSIPFQLELKFPGFLQFHKKKRSDGG
ncbi:hypothetical protein L1987_68484 [Smallanthus sonchifolius]|uniref:Uncharacterized protein n=1 Tax=Smallanthus sonchifolius TaxID=185202 RepID=A0ACB9B4G4_9ASTR|nr:hypothetical protein L1987_68484 [Smallanthus sonchifolius]